MKVNKLQYDILQGQNIQTHFFKVLIPKNQGTEQILIDDRF